MIPPSTPLTPIFGPARYFFFLVNVAFLHDPLEAVAITRNPRKIVIHMLTTGILQLSFELLQTFFELALIHKFNLLLVAVPGRGGQSGCLSLSWRYESVISTREWVYL